MVERLKAFLAPVIGDRRGAAAMILAFTMIPMFGAVGLAVDSSLGYLLLSRMSKALDTAGLAAGRVALNDNAEEVAREYFDANFGTGEGAATLADFTFDLDESNTFVTLTARATTPTFFMRIFGRDQMEVFARTVIERETTGMELALVMDNTGSMWGSVSGTNLSGTPFLAMQNAALDLIDIIYGDETEIDNLWVSLVPYSAMVNIGNSRTGWLRSTDRVFTNPGSYGLDPWKGCVMARATPMDQDDTPPSSNAEKFTSFFYASSSTDNNWPGYRTAYTDRNDAKGPNLGCGPAITPLTPSRATIEAGINNMKPWSRGGTTGNLGLSWGWRTISPRWRGLWGGDTPSTHPLDYGTPLMEKVVVILTDGKNEFYKPTSLASDFTAYGRVNAPGPVGLAKSSVSAGRDELDDRMGETCEDMKDEGIRIYTITFGGTPDTQARDLFRACATTPALYYHAPNNETLATVFRAIGGELANLRIVE
jgi:Flp pilus assembly protein TadG